MSDETVSTTVNRFDFVALGKQTRTPQGGLVVDANLSRTGVQKYVMPDGSIRREYRSREEVFHPESLASFGHSPVTDDHPGRVDTSNWKQVAVGYVAGTPSDRDNKFVAGVLHIQDAKTIEKIESQKLCELSCGYECVIDPTPGISPDGEKFDCSQTRIRGNHVALGPKGWGRAGPEVRLHLDGGVSIEDSVEVIEDTAKPLGYLPSMTDEERKVLAQAEADLAKANSELVKARQDSAKAESEAERTKTEATQAKAELATVKAENEVLKLQAKRDADDKNSVAAQAQREKEIDETIQVRGDAVKFLGKDWKHAGKDNSAIKREVIAKLEPDMKLDGLEASALDAVYGLALSHAERADSSRASAQVVANAARVDAVDDDEGPAAKARKKMEQNKKDASNTPSRRDRARARGKRDGESGSGSMDGGAR